MANLFDRLSERLGGIIDDVRVPVDLARKLDEAETLLVEGRTDEGLAVIAAVDAARPGLWRTNVLRGLALEQCGELEEAARVLTDAVAVRDDTLLRTALGRIATRLGALRTAREHLDRALERRPDDRERLEILRAAASLDERLGPPGRAIPTLRSALKLAPDDDELMWRLAVALREDGDIDGAITALEPALSLDPPPLGALLLAGELRLARGTSGDRTAARIGYTRILERSSDNPDALEGLAEVHRAEGEVAAALPLLQQALTTAPDKAHGRLHRAIGDCYRVAGQPDRAIEALERAHALEPDHTRGAVALANAHLGHGDVERALALATLVLEREPVDRPARVCAGVAALRAGDVAEAARTLTPLRRPAMEHAALRALGELALAAGDPIEALALLREARALRGGDAQTTVLIEAAVQELAPELPDLPPMAEIAPPSLAPFLDALSEAVARHPLLTDLIPRATALRQHLDTPLTVAVLGEFNAGKSTLINAFLGEDALATGVLPTTSHVNVIRYGPRKVARWTHLDGTVEEIPYADARTLTRKHPETIANLEFCAPHPELRSVHFWDTPGFNAPDSLHEERAREALRTADAVIWMLDANQALTFSEFERLETIPNRREKLLVVLNKADRIGDDPDARSEVEAHVREHVGEELAGLFWLSALRALEVRRAQVAEEPDAGRDFAWEAFEGALEERVFERAGRLKSLEVATGLRRLLREAIARAESTVAEVGHASERLATLRVDLEARRSRWAGELAGDARTALNRGLQEARTQLGQEIAQIAGTGSGLFARREVAVEDRHQVRARVAERAWLEYQEVAALVTGAAARIDGELIEVIEQTAATIGPPESRTLRRRLEGALSETEALRRDARERLATTPRAIVEALTRELGDRVMELVAQARTESERDAALQRLVAPVGGETMDTVTKWAEEYLAVAAGLCERAERDLDILALDIEHRIIRPFSAVLDAIRSDATDAATQALEQ